jgi:uncharacterized protein (DUF4415 family)
MKVAATRHENDDERRIISARRGHGLEHATPHERCPDTPQHCFRPDVRPTDEAFWKDAKVVWPTPKSIVTMRLDADLLAWFRQ